MTVVAVVIPTIDGREELLAETLEAYRRQEDGAIRIRLVVVRNHPTIGEGWEHGRRVIDESVPEAAWVNLSADDVAPAPGALRAAIATAHILAYPSPRILNRDGSLHSCGTLGAGMLLPEVPTFSPAGASPFPFLSAAHLSCMPPIPPIHYYADDWLAYQARKLGMGCVVDRAYLLTHLEGTVGRATVAARAMQDRAAMLASLEAEEPRPDQGPPSPLPDGMQARRFTR